MRSVAADGVMQVFASAGAMLRQKARLNAVKVALLVLATMGSAMSAAAQAPQEWTATGVPNQTFPSEPAALAAIQALGGRYALAEVAESITVNSDGGKISYVYGARPRPLNLSEWVYTGQSTVGGPFSSGEEAMANSLATMQAKYPHCGFHSIEVVNDWHLTNEAFGYPVAYNRELRVMAAVSSKCSRAWPVQHFMRRDYSCPQYMSISGGECVANQIARASSKPLPCDPCENRSNPVSVASGSKIQRETDFSLSWLEFYRTLNSSYQSEGGLGRYWTHSLNMRFYGAATGHSVVVYPSGSVVGFKAREATDGSGMTLRSEGSDTILSQEDGLYRFNSSRRLYRIDRFAGDSLNIEFDDRGRIARVVHSSGRSAEFGYTNNLRAGESELAYIKDQDGPLVTYGYDEEFRLISATYRDGSARHYLYENSTYPHALTGIEDEAGNRYATYAYNSDGLAISSEHAGAAQKAGFDYRADGTTVHTNALGGTERVAFTSATPYRKVSSITTQAGTESWEYALPTGSIGDFRRRVKSHTHRSGRIDLYTYQDLTDPVLGDVRIKRETEASNRPEATTTEVWRRRDTNQIVKRVSPARTQTWQHNARGQVIQESTTTPAGESRTTTYSYCEQVNAQAGCPIVGLLLSVDGPLPGPDDTVSYTYYPEDAPGCATSAAGCSYRKGDLWKTIQPLGNITEVLSYDGDGRPHMTMDPNGVVTEYRYTPRGWVQSVTVKGLDDTTAADDRVTTMEYLPTGLVSKVTAPDGSVVTYTYDAAQRLTDVGDGAGNSIHYMLDAAGNRVQEEYKGAGGEVKRTLSRVYNGLSQLVTLADGFANPTDYGYDSEGNQVSITSPLGRVTRHEYDPFSRLKRTVQDVGGIGAETGFQYDPDSNLVQVTDPKGLATTYAYNGFGDAIGQQSPDTGSESYTLDAVGNRKTRTDARGVTATYQYDVLNRLTHISYPDPTLDVVYTYDVALAACNADERFARGRVGHVIHAAGSTDYCYDRFGQVTRKVQTVNGVSTAVRYAYSKAGSLARLTYPDGSIADYVNDSLGRTSEVGLTRPGQARQVVVTDVTYAPFGPITGWTYGNGRRLERPVDADYRPLKVYDAAPGGLSLTFGYDPDGNIVELKDGLGASSLAKYEYDALRRLTQTQDGPTGTPIETYSYDATGNRASLTNSSETKVYSYSAGSHHLAAVGEDVRSYDAVGNTLSMDGREFAYSDANRMKAVKREGVIAEEFVYNHRGERVERTPAAENALQTLYNETGRALGNYTSTGEALQQVIWLEGLPIAVIGPGGGGLAELIFIQPDHLGTPRVVVDSARDVPIWEWNSQGEAFGNQAPATDPDGDGIAFHFSMRFPGQQSTESSGLEYNTHRDYDPSSGRYVQSDPIGLSGGTTTYGYVSGNPLSNSDPLGLADRQLGDHKSGRWIDCGKGCRIRIDFNLDMKTGQLVRHLHWECRDGREGECGENGEKSHGGSWEDAPRHIRDCALKNGFSGAPSPLPAPPPSRFDGLEQTPGAKAATTGGTLILLGALFLWAVGG